VVALDVVREDTVDAIARRATALAGAPFGRRPPALVFGGKRLRGDRALSDYGVRPGAALALAPRALREAAPDAPAGSPPPAPAPGPLAGDASPRPRAAHGGAAGGAFGDCRWD
jgi:hypothetical protein